MIFPNDEVLRKLGIDKVLCPWSSLNGFECLQSFISFSIGSGVTENHKIAYEKLFFFTSQLKLIKSSDLNPNQFVLDIHGEQIQNESNTNLAKALYDVFSKTSISGVDYWLGRVEQKDNGERIYFFCCTEDNIKFIFTQFLSFCGICNLPTIAIGQEGCYVCKLTDFGKAIHDIYIKNKNKPHAELITGQSPDYNQLSSLIKDGKGKVIVNVINVESGSSATIQLVGGDVTDTNMTQGDKNEQKIS